MISFHRFTNDESSGKCVVAQKTHTQFVNGSKEQLERRGYHLATISLPFSKMVYRGENRCLIGKNGLSLGKSMPHIPSTGLQQN